MKEHSGRPSAWNADTRVLVDHSSIFGSGWSLFARRYIEGKRSSATPIVPRVSVDEMNSIALKEEDKQSAVARRALKRLRLMVERGEMQIIGDPDDPADSRRLFLQAIKCLAGNSHTVLVTQRGGLAAKALSLDRQRRKTGVAFPIHAIRVGELGVPEEWRPTSGEFVEARPFEAPFKRVDRTANSDVSEMAVRRVPGKGDVVLVDGTSSPIRLLDDLGRGGEGKTYATEDECTVCKVYSKSKLRRATADKLRLMVSRRVDHRSICWPESRAYNEQGELIGYLMPRADGIEMARSVFIKPRLMQCFPSWTRVHLVDLAMSVLDAVLYLHSLNVVIGDVNARNILVKDENTIFFVDCDSYQVEGMPCPVGTPPFLASRLAGEDLRSTLRSVEDENFAVSTLVFMILLPGKPPYSHQGGGDPMKNVRERKFSYQLGDRSGSNAPRGPWRFMFSHLPYKLKKMFHEVFLEGNDIAPIKWFRALSDYRSIMADGHLSTELFPTSFKQLTKKQVLEHGGEWRTCGSCGRGFGVWTKEDFGICVDCRRKQSRVEEDDCLGRQRRSRSESHAEPRRTATSFDGLEWLWRRLLK